MKRAKKKKAEIIINDFYTRCPQKQLFAKAIRLTSRLSQQSIANKGHYNCSYISNFENDVPLKPDVIVDIYRIYEAILYETYAALDEEIYILFCVRLMCNYAYEMYDRDMDNWDDDLKETLNRLIALL